MAFPKNLLNNHEEVVLDLNPHWVYLLFPSVVLGASVFASLLVLFGWDPSGTVGSVIASIAGIAVLVSLAWFGWTYAKWRTTMFVLTTDRIITRRGVLSKAGVEIPLERVNTVFFQQRLIERMVGAGDIAIESAGERGTETFSDIRKPSIVQKEIYVQMEANENRKFDRMHPNSPHRGGVAAAAAGDQTTVQGGDIPEQIHKLSELHQRGVLSDAEFTRKKAELLDRM